jgi:hypothetical protein
VRPLTKELKRVHACGGRYLHGEEGRGACQHLTRIKYKERARIRVAGWPNTHSGTMWPAPFTVAKAKLLPPEVLYLKERNNHKKARGKKSKDR